MGEIMNLNLRIKGFLNRHGNMFKKAGTGWKKKKYFWEEMRLRMTFWDIHLWNRILNQHFLLFWSLMELLYHLHRTSVTARSCHYDPHSYHSRIKGPDFMTTRTCLSCQIVFSGCSYLICLHTFKASWKCQGVHCSPCCFNLWCSDWLNGVPVQG